MVGSMDTSRTLLTIMPGRRAKRTKRKTGQPKLIRSGFQQYPAPIRVPLVQSIRIQLRNIITVTSDGSGVINGVLPCNPNATLSAPFASVALFNEYSSWSNLFNQVKAIQLEVTLRPCYIETKGDVITNLVISGSLQSSTAPGSFLAVVDNGDSQTWTPSLDTSGRGVYHAIRHKRSLLPAASTNPVPSTSNYVGCPGGIGMYGSGLPLSTHLFDALVVGTYLLSSRS